MAATITDRTQPSRTLTGELAATLPGALLILLMTGAVVWSLAVSQWAAGLEVLRPLALIGLLVGIIFARLPRLPGWLAHLLSAALACTWAVQLLCDQMDARLLTWRDHGADLLVRVIMWGRVLRSGGRGEDILLFVLALCLLVWALAYGTAWMSLRCGWTWRPIILNALVALVNYTYVLPKPTLAFFVFLCAALLLLVYQYVREQQAAWDAQHIEYPDMLALRFLWSAALVCGLLIALTASLPGEISVDRATRTWALLSGPFRTARERWEDLFSTISAPPGAGSGAFTSRGAVIGGARELTTDAVMEVRSTEYDYWRAVAFDKYTGHGWQNTVGEQARAVLGVGTPEQARTALNADEPLSSGDVQARREVVQTFTMAADRLDDLVMVGGTLRSVSIPTLVEHNYDSGSGTPQPNFDDLALVVARERLRAGQTYTVTAMMSFADIASLRAAGATYPQWVRERYLQLSDTLTPRTRELAAKVVADANARTPYDVAVAVQTYLRTLRYTTNVPAQPAGADTVDWFLFDQREGYCDYFASSMVVLLRAQGVPARWVRGYAGGAFDAERGVYVVRENVAHSWPEVYFPGFGWQRFEPTAADYTSLPLRPLTANAGTEPSATEPPPAPAPSSAALDTLDETVIVPPVPSVLPNVKQPNTGDGRPLALLAGVLGLVALAAAALYGRWRYELRGLSQAGVAYAGLVLLAGWGGLRQQAHRTPREFAAALGAALPEHQPAIEQIVGVYVREQYGGPVAASGRALPSAEATNALRRALVRRMFTALVAKLPQAGSQGGQSPP